MSILQGSLVMEGCACGGTIKGEGTDLSTGITKCKCNRCGREKDRYWGKKVVKELRWDTNFFIMRKHWARNLLASAGLNNPGDSIEGVFDEVRYEVSIGSRGGVRICESA